MWLVDENTTSPFEIYKETEFTSLYSAVEALKGYATNSASEASRSYCTMRIRFVHKLSGENNNCDQACKDYLSCGSVRITFTCGKLKRLCVVSGHPDLWSDQDKIYYNNNRC